MSKKEFNKWFFEQGDFWPTPDMCYDKMMEYFAPIYDEHDGGKVECHPQFIQGYNKGYAESKERIKQLEDGIKKAMEIRATPYGSGDYEILKEVLNKTTLTQPK